MGDIRPTAKWANRMLRPLTSIHHRLEKHQELLSAVADAKSSTTQRPEPATTNGSATATRGSTRTRANSAATAVAAEPSDDEPDDPAWAPGNPVKRQIRRNYSNRGQRKRRSRLSIRSPEVPRTLPGAIEIATPLITGKKTARNLLEASAVRRRLFRNPSPGTDKEASEVEEGRRTTVRASFGGATTGCGGCYVAYNGSWKEALDRSADTGLVDIVRLLDRLFLKFLHNTRVQPQQQQPARGARSLMSMTVRRLPEFIAAEQELQDEEDNEEDMCDAYFTELEAHYAPSGNGWLPLREAVRAQGIQLVSEMLRNRRVTKLISCRLLQGCLDQQEYDAFESLLSGFLSLVDDTYDYPQAFDSVLSPVRNDDPVTLLSSYYSRNPGCRSFVFGELAKLLGRKVIPPEWMVTAQWKRTVDAAIQSLSTEEEDSAGAAHLVEAVVLSACSVYPAMNDNVTIRASGTNAARSVRGRGTRASQMHATEMLRDQSPCPVPIQDALSNLTLSLITALCGMHLARTPSAEEQEDPGVGLRVRGIMGYLAFAVQREIEIRPLSGESELPTFHVLRRGCVLLGECLLECGEEAHSSETCSKPDYHHSRSPPSNISSFYEYVGHRPEVIKELAVLARQVFRCSEHVMHRSDGQSRTSPVMRIKVEQLADKSSARHLSTFLGKVASETAMQLAEMTVDPDDHVWAGEVQERVVSRQHGQQLLLLLPQLSGSHLAHGQADEAHERSGLYRWEEIIEEWVARTPERKDNRMKGIDLWKPVGVVVDGPGVGASNSPSSCPSSSPSSVSARSEDAASSVTSSAPSLPVKRKSPTGRSQERPASPPSKRLRSSTSRARQLTAAEEVSKQDQLPAVSSTTPDDDDCPEESSSPRRTRRGTQLPDLDTGPAPSTRRRRMTASQASPTVGSGGTTGRALEVVICTNRKPDTDTAPPRSPTPPPPPPRRSLSGNSVVAWNNKADRRANADRGGGSSGRKATRSSLRPTIIPRRSWPVHEQEESDDELSLP